MSIKTEGEARLRFEHDEALFCDLIEEEDAPEEIHGKSRKRIYGEEYAYRPGKTIDGQTIIKKPW